MAIAGPSRLPYVELPVSSSHSNGRPKSYSNPSAAARVLTDVNANTSSHGSTTQESSNPAQNSLSNGYHHISDSDDEEEDSVQVGKGTYSTSDAIVHRALRPRTGRSRLYLRRLKWLTLHLPGYCYSTKMTYHAYVGADAEDVHPEEPDRIVGIHQRLQGVQVIRC
jgi:hypothetical protein